MSAQNASTVCLAFVLVLFWSCRQTPEPLGCIEKIRQEGVLLVLTRNAPTTYFLGRNGYEGFEYELVNAFADHLGVEAKFIALDTTHDILEKLTKGEGHFGAAGLTRTKEREASFLFGPDYLEVQQQVVSRRRGRKPKNLDDLTTMRLAIIAGSSYEERLLQLQMQFPHMHWTATLEKETEELLEDVWSREIDCTIADSNIVAINRRYFPELQVAFSLGTAEQLAWALGPDCAELLPEMETWFKAFEASGALDALKERYFAFVPIFDYVDIRSYKRRILSRLPKYERYFKEAAGKNDFDWTLLAAQAYQESHWLARATSPTGVRGIMMLTQNTSEQLGIEDRLDPKSSIFGGAQYLRQIYNRLPETVVGQDRKFFALAAYNVGYGHLMDARRLAKRKKLNPNLWRDVRTILPLLSQKRYYRQLRYGYARGMEPVRYVQRIRDFQDILERELALANVVEGL